MPEVLLPPDIIPQSEDIELVDDGSRLFAPAQGLNVSQVQQDYEPRLRVTQRFKALRSEDRARMKAALNAVSGQYGTIRARVGRVFRGSMPVTEVLPYGTFSSGTTGWQSFNSDSSISVVDRILKSTVIKGAGENYVTLSATPVTTQYAPYIARAFIYAGRETGAAKTYNLLVSQSAGSNTQFSSGNVSPGLVTAAGVSALTALHWNIGVNTSGLVSTAGDYFTLLFASLGRGMQVDNGQNMLLQSDVLGTTWTTTRAGVASDSATAPDGTLTGDALAEDGTAANTHYASQNMSVSSSAADYAYTHSIKAGTRSFVCLSLSEGTSGHEARVFVNVSTGTIGTTTTTGANMTNARAYITDQGNGWYGITLVARKANAATVLGANLYIAEADNDLIFNGLSANSLFVWRGTVAQSSVPTRQIQTTTTATTGTSQTGNGLYLKGAFPVSTSGLMRADDVMEINGELLQLTTSLDSNGLALAYVQFKPSLFRSPADGDPVICANPMPKLKLIGNAKWTNEFGLYSDLELVMEQRYE